MAAIDITIDCLCRVYANLCAAHDWTGNPEIIRKIRDAKELVQSTIELAQKHQKCCSDDCTAS